MEIIESCETEFLSHSQHFACFGGRLIVNIFVNVNLLNNYPNILT